MDKVNKTINFSKGGSGSYTPKVNLPMQWVKDMMITKEDNGITLEYDRETKVITIKKTVK